MPLPFPFDFKNPDYLEVFAWRRERLARLRAEPGSFDKLKPFYRENPAQFITDWGCTADPRHVEIGLPVIIPFLLFPKQEDCIGWVLDCWRSRKFGGVDKSREMGVSWLMVALADTLCIFNDDLVAGFGSRTEDDVDKTGDPSSLLYKARQFISLVPVEFRGGWDEKKHSQHMRIYFPGTRSSIIADAGKNVGRGGRTSIYFVDEAAWLEKPEMIEASLSQTTNCRIDISTPHGRDNPFARKKEAGVIPWFTFHWRDDPRKDDAWYAAACEKIGDPVIIAQEIDIDYNASVGGLVIPAAWVESTIDAHVKLGLTPSGVRKLALDIADEGRDLNAAIGRHGFLLENAEEWSGKGSDIFGSVEHSVILCDRYGYTEVDYDADGLGAGARGDARIINDRRIRDGMKPIKFNAWRGSGEVGQPEAQMIEGRKNKDYFENEKARAWWALRYRVLATHRWVTEGVACRPEMIISIPSTLPKLGKLTRELSQPTWSIGKTGKTIINKKPDNAPSPNLADGVMMAFAPSKLYRGFYD